MASGLANILPVSAPSLAVRLEPHVIEVVVWYPFGATDEAVAAAAAKVEELLARPDLGAALATTPDVTDDSPRVATTAMVQAIFRLAVEQAREIAQAAIVDLLTTPGKLRELLPVEPPPDAATPWLDKNLIALTPDA